MRDTPQGLSQSCPHCPPGNSFVRHNVHQLTRVYPLGLRMNSANYSPQEMWNSGCQLGERGQQEREWAGAALWGRPLESPGSPMMMGPHSFPEGGKRSFVENNNH